MKPVEKVLGGLRNVEQKNGGWQASCPVPGHGQGKGDRSPSLQISEDPEGKVLIKCWCGCSKESVLDSLGLGWSDLFPQNGHGKRKKADAIWEIKDSSGTVQAEHHRVNTPDGGKDVFWKLPGARDWGLKGRKLESLPLYGSERVTDADNLVVLVEGEPPADALREAGITALATVTGASGTPSETVLSVVQDMAVVIWPDNDNEGRSHMHRVAERLQGIASSIHWYEWPDAPEKGDAADHPNLSGIRESLLKAPEWEPRKEDGEREDDSLAAGGTVEELVSMAEDSAVLRPDTKRRGIVPALADAITATDHFARDGGDALYRYKGGTYRENGEGFVHERAKHLLNEWGLSAKWSSNKAQETVRYIATDCPVLWERPPMDKINVLNGLLDVRTRELEPHSPEFLSPVQIPVEYDPEAECPAWDRFIEQTFPEDARDLAYELVGWLMVPDTAIQKAVLLTGEGSNGKSVYLSALTAFIGERNIATVPLQRLESDRFSAARLVGKLANICADLPSDHLSSSSTFKALTGGDALLAERKYGSSFEMRPHARMLFSANQPPRSGDASYAFFRRWLVLPFERTFEPSEQKPRNELDAELQGPRELSGVLNKALVALMKIRGRNGLSEPQSVKEAHEEFRRTTDPLSTWLDRNTVEHPDAVLSRGELSAAYTSYRQENGEPGMSAQAFGKALKRLRPNVRKGQTTYRGKQGEKVYYGIGLRSEDPHSLAEEWADDELWRSRQEDLIRALGEE